MSEFCYGPGDCGIVVYLVHDEYHDNRVEAVSTDHATACQMLWEAALEKYGDDEMWGAKDKVGQYYITSWAQDAEYAGDPVMHPGRTETPK